MSYGIISSKEGVNVSENTVDKDLTINSDYLTFSVYEQGDTTITVDDKGGNANGKFYRKSVSHDLGYPGQLMAYHLVPSNFSCYPGQDEWFSIPFSNQIFDTNYDTMSDIGNNDIRFSFVSYFDALASTDMSISYLLLIDSLTETDYIKSEKTGYGIKASESGDIRGVTAENLSFSSEYPIVQVEKSSEAIDIPATTYGSWSKMTVNHGLGYVPAFYGYDRIWSVGESEWLSWYSQPSSAHSQVEPWEEVGCKMSVDKDNLYIYYRNGVDGAGGAKKAFDYQVRYDIFTNKISD